MDYIFLGFLSLLSLCAFGQTIQRGVVQEYNEKDQKTPLGGVEFDISAASSTFSDKNGNYSLSFKTLKKGDRVLFRNDGREIKKDGYEIFNKAALEQWNLNPDAPFNIVMCRSDKFKATCDNIFSKASPNYKKQRDAEIAKVDKLKAEGKLKEEVYYDHLKKIQESYDRQLCNLSNYVDRFARIDLSEISEVEQEIVGLVEQGLFNNIGMTYYNLGDNPKALEYNNKALDIQLKAYGEEHPDVAASYINIGLTYNNLGDNPKALEYNNQALDIWLKSYGEEHPDVAASYNNIGMAYGSLGDNSRAIDYNNKSLGIKLKVYGEENPDVALSYNNIGVAYGNLGDNSRALEYYNKALDILLKMHGEQHPDIITIRSNINYIKQLQQNAGNSDDTNNDSALTE